MVAGSETWEQKSCSGSTPRRRTQRPLALKGDTRMLATRAEVGTDVGSGGAFLP